jgi:hypothetical protein
MTAVIMLLSVISCSDRAASGIAADTETAVSETESEETTRVYPDLPNTTFDGENVCIVNIDYNIPIWAQRDIYAETLTGEIINDAVYTRNSAIEEKYNLKIVSRQVVDTLGEITKANAAADGGVDLATVALKTFATLATQKALVELHSVPYMDLDKPWYDKNSIECLSIAKKLYGVCSDYTIMDKDATTAMVFNKMLLGDFKLEDPYELVKNGTWTLDKLIEMSSNVSSDLNGDSVYDDNDRYGLLYQRDTMSSFLNGCGGLIAQKDSDDIPVFCLNTDSSIAILNRLYDYLYDEQTCFHVMKFFDPKPEGFTNGMVRMFQANCALFMWIRIADVENLRSMEVDFGILPIPKGSESQDRYYNSVNPWVGSAVVVPKCSPNLDKTGIFIEAISAESRYTLQPVYYEKVLTGKIARDNESEDMLDIIFGTRVYDNGDIYDLGGMGTELINMTMTYNRDISSKIASKEKAIAKAIEKLVKNITED